MAKQGTILVVDDNKAVLNALEMLLAGVFREVITLRTPNQIEAILESGRVDVVLLDMNFSAGINTGNEGLYWLSRIKEYAAEIPVVLFTAYADIDLAVRAVKEGATDFVVKPWDNAKLVATLLAAYRLHESRREVKQLKAKEEVLKGQLSPERTVVWGESDVMRRVRQLIEKVAVTDANVLITGENGTGKEIVAREIHALSGRRGEVMISVDMGAITETLFESELFGHVKGAFTDAREDRVGKFEAANKGTLFLDEIGNLSYALQSKLLATLQSRKVIRVGSNKPIDVNIRLICATNSDLSRMVKEGTFREDLLYRINTIHVEVPPLRERGNDILLLAEAFLRDYGRKYRKPDLSFSGETRQRLLGYSWPGNVRELQHTVEKAVIMCDRQVLTPEDFLFKSEPSEMAPLETLEDMEREMIRKALERHEGNLSAVASRLGITRQTLYNKMKKFNL
ncbi:sigma-54-dependent transcriptional regulator [Butyricimonas virosa]|jgi:DNA-binding NtrC family response regulator|uniref:Sigma-54-dependent Fis family transcriptional regulator n=1 Tax=Butyricimonas virosa TaxID=544645 RepID=A0A412WXR9_9BACT|nr:sigma-54 dependent transcriptional regulator [Butyricimonas virosa]RGV32383.1 sigma-54-dependent Fis family transcriptional regulator [Butyricimonas virosa]